MDIQNTYLAIDGAAKIKRFALVLCGVPAIAIGAVGIEAVTMAARKVKGKLKW